MLLCLSATLQHDSDGTDMCHGRLPVWVVTLVGRNQVLRNLDEYGNTSAASIPLALAEAVQSGKVKKGDIVATAGFGAGQRLSFPARAVRCCRLLSLTHSLCGCEQGSAWGRR